MSGDLAPFLGAAAIVAAVALTWAVRLSQTSRPAEPETATFYEPEPGVRWLRCDELACAHMTRKHRPRPDGRWACSYCGHLKGGEE
ncbi:hypothetical protein ACIQUY_29445 [Streptomyces sp. NPDC090231]|uniref:hypothetical protein n=1 Tax=unclassified Streptomyces TaxID=2593676 RepID=UPI00381353A2